MSASIQCVFLIDESIFCSSEDKNSHLCDRLRLSVLRLLCYFNSIRSRSSFSVRWSYRFFDSEGLCPQSTEKLGFSDFCLENFENFEACLVNKAEKKRSIKLLNTRARDSRSKCEPVETSSSPEETLSVAFRQLYADYVWDLPDISSPVKTLGNSGHKPQKEHENYIFVLASYVSFVESPAGDPFKKLLPKSLHEILSCMINLMWIDTHSSTSDMTMKVKRQLPLSLLTADMSYCKGNMVLPLSGLMTYFLTPKPRRSSGLQESSDSVFRLHLKGKLLCELSLFHLRKTQAAVSDAFKSGEILGSLPVSWISRASLFSNTSVIAQILGSEETATFSSPFLHLLKQMKNDSRILLLQDSSTSDCPTQLSLLQYFGPGFCLIIPLKPGLSVNEMSALACKESETKHCLWMPSFLEQWIVPTAHSSFVTDSNPDIRRFRRHAIKDLQHCFHKVSSILSPSKTKRRSLRSCRTTKTLSEKDLSESRRSTHKDSGSVVLALPDTKNLGAKKCLSENLESSSLTRAQSKETNYVNLQIEGSNSEGCFKVLHELYEKALDGRRSVEKVAESIISDLHFCALSQNLDTNDLAVQEEFLLTAKIVGDKHEARGESRGLGRQRELQLQALLRLELQQLGLKQYARVPQRDLQQSVFTDKSSLQEIVILLRTFSFLAGALELNMFLLQTLKPRYSHTLHHLLQEISEELNVPLSSDSDDSNEEESTSTGINPLSNCSQSSFSSVSSVSQQPKNSTRKPWSRSLSVLNASGSRRQIKVPRNLLNSTVSSSSSTSVKHSKKAKNRKPSVKKSKVRTFDEKKRAGHKKACRNLLDKLDPGGQSTLGKSKSENFISAEYRQNELYDIEVHNSKGYSPCKVEIGSPKAHSQCSPRAPGNKIKSMLSPKQKQRSSPRTPKTKFKQNMSGFTPSKDFPDLMGTPDHKDRPSSRQQPQNSPRTPRQISKQRTSGFTRSNRFPDLTSPTESVRSTEPRLQRSPTTPKQSTTPKASRFTPRSQPAGLTDTPGSVRNRKTPSSNKKDGHIDFTSSSPASCTRSKCNLLSSPAVSALITNTPKHSSAHKLARRNRSSSCIRKLTLDSPVKSETSLLASGTESVGFSSPARSPRKVPRSISFLNASPKSKRPAANFTVEHEVVHGSPFQSCSKESPVKQVRISGTATTQENVYSFGDTPRKRHGEIKLVPRISFEKDVSPAEADTKSTIHLNERREGASKASSSELLSDARGLLTDKFSPVKYRRRGPPEDQNNKICSHKRELTTPERVPIVELNIRHRNSEKSSIKTSPVLSKRWPQKKRKLGYIQKKNENLRECKISPNQNQCPVSPPAKKHQAGKRYASPSTLSILHLTTSPVISCRDNVQN